MALEKLSSKVVIIGSGPAAHTAVSHVVSGCDAWTHCPAIVAAEFPCRVLIDP